ncbi:MAG: ubiquinol-cytochrome c reductase iron-sulfur subunit [Nitrospinota bacterium]
MEEVRGGDVGRRGFLQWLSAAVVGVGTAAFAAGVLAYLYPPGLRRRSRAPVAVPGAEALSPGGSVEVRVDGAPALLLRAGEGYRAFLLTCTHLGCVVRWRPKAGSGKAGDALSAGRFVCPCHGGVFDSQGRVIDGPPPRPLERLEVSVREGGVFIV